MDEIYIPLAKELSGATYEMVDKFSSYAEALSVPIFKDKRESFIAIAKHILKKTTKQHNDVDNLFNILQKVIMILVGECLKQFPTTAYTKDRLPNPTRLQKQAAETPVKTFDDVWVERIKHRSLQIEKMVEKHQSRLRKLVTAQELCWKAEAKFKEVDLTVSTSIHSRDFQHQRKCSSAADVRTRDREIEKLTDKLGKTSQLVVSRNFDYEEKVGYESAARNNLHRMSEELCNLIRIRITERLIYGVDCLRDVIARISDVDKYEECLQLLAKIDIPKIVRSILTASSEKYVCPRVNEYNEIYGFKTRLPVGKVVRGTDVITDIIGSQERKMDRKIKRQQIKPEEEEAKSPSQQSSADKDMEINEEKKSTAGDNNDPNGQNDLECSAAEQKIAEAPPSGIDFSEVPPSGIVPLTKSTTYVTVPAKVTERAPGLLKLKKGLRIKQKVEFDDVDLCFGWCRPRILSTKVWGFYYKRQVQDGNK